MSEWRKINFWIQPVHRTADYDTVYTIYLFLCTQSAMRILFERRAVIYFFVIPFEGRDETLSYIHIISNYWTSKIFFFTFSNQLHREKNINMCATIFGGAYKGRHTWKKCLFLVVGPLRVYPLYTNGLVVHATFFLFFCLIIAWNFDNFFLFLPNFWAKTAG